MTCPFCEFSENRIIEEGKFWRVILSNPRLVPGHTLIIPKRHLVRMSELTSEEWSELQPLFAKYEELILSRLATGCDIKQHYRPFIPDGSIKQSHLHIHLIPRSFEDALYNESQVYEKTLFQPLSKQEEEKYLELFR